MSYRAQLWLAVSARAETPARHTEASGDGPDFSTKHLADKCRIALRSRRGEINRYNSNGIVGVRLVFSLPKIALRSILANEECDLRHVRGLHEGKGERYGGLRAVG